jgi:FkbM family methyltransferase
VETVCEELVFDIGMHVGDDTAYYLKRGYDVVAVEAHPALVREARHRLADALAAGRLTVLEAAVVREARDEADFHVSRQAAKSSLARQSAEGGGYEAASIKVPTITLPALMRDFGIPVYCKIDIEGGDLDALKSLEGESSLPPYLSVESGGLPGEPLYDGEAGLATLRQLESLGYRHFKLVDQSTLNVLPLDRRVYSRQPNIVDRVAAKLGRPRETWRRRFLYHRMHHHFSLNSSGPFGDDLPGIWVDFETARRMLQFHADDVRAAGLQPSVFWCDWHAKL